MGQLSFEYMFGNVVGQTYVYDSAIHTSTFVSHTSTTQATLILMHETAKAKWINNIDTSSMTPIIDGFGEFSYVNVVLGGTGSGIAETLNDGTGGIQLQMLD